MPGPGDLRFQAEPRRRAEAALSGCAGVDCMKIMGGEYSERTLRLRAAGAADASDDPAVAGGAGVASAAGAAESVRETGAPVDTAVLLDPAVRIVLETKRGSVSLQNRCRSDD